MQISCIDDGFGNVKVIPDYFGTLISIADTPQQRGPDSFRALESSLLFKRKLRRASSMLRLFNLRGLLFSGMNGEEKIELSSVQLESLRSELADVEEREAHFKAQLEHLDEILRCSRLSGYMCIRTRWAALPGEPLPIDDSDVDDWIPRFVVLQGSCIFFYKSSTDLSPQDSTLLSEISDIRELPNFVRENEEIWHCFCMGTRYGLRIECSSASRIQIDAWLTALRTDCKLGPDQTDSADQNCKYNSQDCTNLEK